MFISIKQGISHNRHAHAHTHNTLDIIHVNAHSHFFPASVTFINSNYIPLCSSIKHMVTKLKSNLASYKMRQIYWFSNPRSYLMA